MVKNLRISMVCSYFLPFLGGIELHVDQLARKLSQGGSNVIVYASTDMPDGSLRLSPGLHQRDDYRIVRQESVAGGFLPGLLSHNDFRSCDIVHFHGVSRLLLSEVAALKRETPLVLTPHGGLRFDGNPSSSLSRRLFDSTILRALARSVSAIIASVRSEGEFYVSRPQFRRSRVFVVPTCGVDGRVFRERHVSRGKPHYSYLLTLARISSIKRLSDVILTIPSFPELHYVIGGTGDLKATQALLQVAKQSGVSERVHLVGKLNFDQKMVYLNNCLAYVQPSEYECTPLSVAEAMAVGTPIVATETGGLPEMLDYGASGLLYPIGSIAKLRERISTILSKEETVAQLTENAKEKADREYRWESIAEHVKEVYESVTSQ